MNRNTPNQIAAEIEALKARIRRLRTELKAARLAEAEDRLMRLAKSPINETPEGGSDAK